MRSDFGGAETHRRTLSIHAHDHVTHADRVSETSDARDHPTRRSQPARHHGRDPKTCERAPGLRSLKEAETPNAEHPTPNIEFRDLHSALDVGRWTLDVCFKCRFKTFRTTDSRLSAVPSPKRVSSQKKIGCFRLMPSRSTRNSWPISSSLAIVSSFSNAPATSFISSALKESSPIGWRVISMPGNRWS